MKHVRSLRFEALEVRQMLSETSLPVADPAPALASPIVLDGTLKVEYGAHGSALMRNANGSKTRSIRVAGQLGSLGRVHGIWDESVDVYGNYDGPDTLRLMNSKGKIVVSFFNQNSPRGVAKLASSTSYEHAQQVVGSAGAYAGATETGSIVLTTSATGRHVVTLTLHTAGP